MFALNFPTSILIKIAEEFRSQLYFQSEFTGILIKIVEEFRSQLYFQTEFWSKFLFHVINEKFHPALFRPEVPAMPEVLIVEEFHKNSAVSRISKLNSDRNSCFT